MPTITKEQYDRLMAGYWRLIRDMRATSKASRKAFDEALAPKKATKKRTK